MNRDELPEDRDSATPETIPTGWMDSTILLSDEDWETLIRFYNNS